jgi:preprotein translocase subunit SecG
MLAFPGFPRRGRRIDVFWVVLPIHVLASLFLILVVLLQSGKGGDIASAFGGGGTQSAFGPRGSSNVLTKTTAVVAAIFMITSLSLVMLSQSSRRSVLDDAAAPPAAEGDVPIESVPPVEPVDETATPTDAGALGQQQGDSPPPQDVPEKQN